MQSAKLSIDFSDDPKLMGLLRLVAARSGRSQKQVVTDALNAYFAHSAEAELLTSAANHTFAEWDNADDEVYNSL